LRTSIPLFAELPIVDGDTGRSAWGVFGDDDRLGTLNFVSPEAIARASRHVQQGRVYRLDLPLDAVRPGLTGRTPPEHHLVPKEGDAADDWIDRLFPQGSTHWDAIRHIKSSTRGFYNGTPAEDVGREAQLGIDTFAKNGIVGRGVLLDLARYLESTGRPLDPTAGTEIGVDVLEACATFEGLEIEQGDILVLRTGWVRWYLERNDDERAALAAAPRHVLSSGLAASDEMVEYLWDTRVAAVAADNIAVEVSGAGGKLHRKLLPEFGMCLGELWYLEELAAECPADGIYTFLLVSAPLYLRGGVASPANAVAIR
jgi:kynurenine formamidase